MDLDTTAPPVLCFVTNPLARLGTIQMQPIWYRKMVVHWHPRDIPPPLVLQRPDLYGVLLVRTALLVRFMVMNLFVHRALILIAHLLCLNPIAPHVLRVCTVRALERLPSLVCVKLVITVLKTRRRQRNLSVLLAPTVMIPI